MYNKYQIYSKIHYYGNDNDYIIKTTEFHFLMLVNRQEKKIKNHRIEKYEMFVDFFYNTSLYNSIVLKIFAALIE